MPGRVTPTHNPPRSDEATFKLINKGEATMPMVMSFCKRAVMAHEHLKLIFQSFISLRPKMTDEVLPEARSIISWFAVLCNEDPQEYLEPGKAAVNAVRLDVMLHNVVRSRCVREPFGKTGPTAPFKRNPKAKTFKKPARQRFDGNKRIEAPESKTNVKQ